MVGLIFILGWILITGFLMLLTPSDHSLAYDGPPIWLGGVLIGWSWPVVVPILAILGVLYLLSKNLSKLGGPLRAKLGLNE